MADRRIETGGKGRRKGTPRSTASVLVAVSLLVALGAAAAIWGPQLLQRQSYQLTAEKCTATHGEYVDYKTAEQANNAAIIAAVGLSYGFDVQGVTVALATAIQESSLRNLDYGDRDSVGLFQQRPSQGWGTVEQIMDPRYSSAMFYQALDQVEGWQDMRLTDAAQAVQRSGFPEAYEDHKDEALAWATAFTGGDATVDCHVSPVPSSATDFADRIALDFGSGRYTLEVLELGSDATVLGIRAVDASLTSEAGLLEWVVATASTTGATRVTFAGDGWHNGDGRYVDESFADTDPASEPLVTVSLGSE